jgi:hypothetical protein
VLQIGNEEVKLSVFTDDIILYLTNPKDASRRFLDLINTFNKISKQKINTQKQ